MVQEGKRKRPPYSDLTFYDDNLGLYERLKDEVLFALGDAIEFKVHSLAGRVKDRKSVADKLLRKSYSSPETQMEDLVGVRIICLFTSDLEKADGLIRSLFDVKGFEDKQKAGGDDQFGYASAHYICSLRDVDSGPRYDRLRGLKFEIQCRTILMDAWANISHHLAYKGQHSLPSDKKKDFHALAGLLHVADEQFEQLAAAAVGSASASSDAPLDRDQMVQLLTELYPNRDNDPTSESQRQEPEDILRSMSELVEDVVEAGYKTVGHLKSDLETCTPAALKSEEENPPGILGSKYFRVGIARHALAIGNEKFRLQQYAKMMGSM